MTPLLAQSVLPGFEHLVAPDWVDMSLWNDPGVNLYEDELGWHVGAFGWPFVVGSFDYCVKTLEEMEQATRRYIACDKS